jgi:EAL and modified HD-GYP domain-containing signal transduction protein
MKAFGFQLDSDTAKPVQGPQGAALTRTEGAGTASPHVFIGRQPILGEDQKIYAYELLFRDSKKATGAQVLDNTHATSQVVINTFNNFGVERVLGGSKAFINFATELLETDIPELLPPDKVVLEILEHVEPTPAVIARCRQLRERGYHFALDDFLYKPELEPLIALSEYVKFDVRALTIAGMAAQMQQMRGHALRVIAEKVETQEEFRACRALRVNYFQGYYFAKPETLTMKRLEAAVQRIMFLFNLITTNAAPERIELEFKQDVALSFKLLHYINSVGFGLTNQVNSIKHALVLLGRTKLARWLGFLLMSGARTGVAPEALFRTALVRARMIELLGRRFVPAAEHDYLFMTGMFSLLDAMLEAPLAETLNSLHLPDKVSGALLEGKGPYTVYLHITRASEGLEMARVEELCQPLGLTLADVTQAQMEAQAWAEEISASAR